MEVLESSNGVRRSYIADKRLVLTSCSYKLIGCRYVDLQGSPAGVEISPAEAVISPAGAVISLGMAT